MSDFEVEFDLADQEVEAVFELNVAQSYKFRDGITEKGGIVTLDKATKESIGGIIVGENLDVTETGILSADVGHGVLTVKVDDEEVGTFSANAKENVEINIDLPEVTWGNIQGNIEDQTDLMETLDDLEDAVNDRIDEVEDTLTESISTTKEELTEEINKKQDILTSDNAGPGISITNEEGIVKINNTRVSAVWGNIEGDITDQTDLVEYIDEYGGKIDVIKRNEVVLPIEDKTVNIEVPEEANEIDYTNGAVPSITNVQEALDNLMNIHYYVNPSYTTFTVDRSGNYDVGTVLEQPFAINWTLNKTPVAGDTQTLKLDGTTILNIMNEDPSQWKTGSYSYTAQNITSNSPKTYTFRVDYTDNHSTVPSGKTNTCNASRTFTFLYRRYWGVTTTETLSDEQLYALSNELSSSRAQERDFNCSGGKYWWVVIPSTYCNGIQFTDVASGLPMTLPPECISTRTITNSKGISFSVNVYRGEYKQTASSVKIRVS